MTGEKGKERATETAENKKKSFDDTLKKSLITTLKTCYDTLDKFPKTSLLKKISYYTNRLKGDELKLLDKITNNLKNLKEESNLGLFGITQSNPQSLFFLAAKTIIDNSNNSVLKKALGTTPIPVEVTEKITETETYLRAQRQLTNGA